MASLRLEHVDRTYPGGHVALRGLDLDVADGELLVLVGPSGCGKTTTLRLVAGLDAPTREAVALIQVDEPVPDEVLRKFAALPNIISVKQIEL